MDPNSKACNIIVIGLGLVCVVLGITLAVYIEKLNFKLYKDQLQLTPDSITHKFWSHTPVPLYLEVYLFNWTNVDEYVKYKTAPHFEEIGPFVFSEVHDRVNVIWNDNYTVTYNQTRKWNFIPELSEDLSLEITNLNVIGTTLSQMLKKFSRFKSVINWIFRAENFANTASAKKWIFEGIDDKLLEYVSELGHVFHIPTPKSKFAWFYGRNMSSSYDGIFTVFTGTDNLYKVGLIDKWNGVNQTHFFEGRCGTVNGTSGELFPPMTLVPNLLNIFISDICSSLKLFYNETSTVDGIEVDKFVGKAATFDNGQCNPLERCNCHEKCIPLGVRDVSTCKNAPLFFSFPHFYLSDPSYRKMVSGLMPNESEHEFMIMLDTVTGMPFDVKAQLQINVRLEPVPWLNMFSNVSQIYIPMMWFRQKAKITPELASEVYFLHILPEITAAFTYGVLAIGLLIVITRVIAIWRNSKQNDDSELLIPPMMDEDVNILPK